MGKIVPLQESFAAGEISPRLLGQRTSDGYQKGVSFMENFIADTRGPALSRHGFRLNIELEGDDARIEYFSNNNTVSALIIFTEFALRVQGQFGSIPEENFVVEPRFGNNGAAWPVVTSGNALITFELDNCAMQPRAGLVQISQAITATASGTQFVQVTADGASDYRIQCGTGPDDNTFFDITTSDFVHVAEFITPGTDYTITITATDDAVTIHSIHAADDLDGVVFTTQYTEGEVHDLYFVAAPAGDTIYILHPRHDPTKLVVDEAGLYTFVDPVAFIEPPPEWAGNSFPSCGDVHEGRLWLAGTPGAPQTFWASRSGVLEDFTEGEAADDSFSTTLSQFGLIVWIISTKNLLLGTINGEHIISSDGVIIIPTDIKVERQSSYGSANIQPRQIGDQVFYVSPDRTKLRAMQYEWSADNWLSKDITFFSEHITAPRIRELAWAQNPNNLLVMALDDGTAAWLTYDRSENIYGWHHHVTQGEFRDFTTGPVNGVSVITAVIQRKPGFINIENTVILDNRFLDSYVAKNDTVPFTVLDGLDHLEGATVQIVSEGAVQAEQVVVGGQITLAAPTTEAYAGLKYTPKMVTLPVESGSSIGAGLAHLKRYNRLLVGLLDSAAPLINGKRIPTRHPATPMNTVEPNTTGQISLHQIGWSDDAIVTIEQDLPLDCVIVFIGGELPQEVT